MRSHHKFSVVGKARSWKPKVASIETTRQNLLDSGCYRERPFMSATVYLETFGCQMNVADSERAAVRLRAAGFDLGDSPESADVIIFNTCSVRERAAHKVFTRIGEVRRQRLSNEPVVGVIGCVAQLEGAALFDNS